MFKSSASKLFFFFLLIFAASCNVWQPSNTPAPSPTPSADTEIKSEIPFSTREPENYQTEIVLRALNGENVSERKILAARSGERRIAIFNFGEKTSLARLDVSEQSSVSIYYEKKIYADLSSNSPASEPVNDFLTTEWLNQKTSAQFENLGTENGLLKFRVKLGETGQSGSEVFVFFDENLKLPVKQEFYNGVGEQKVLKFSVQLENFRLEADNKLFELPRDYRRVSPQEFQEIVWKERAKNE